jgi:hypothetical protein
MNSRFGHRVRHVSFLLALLLTAVSATRPHTFGQTSPPRSDTAKTDPKALELVRDLLSQKPEKATVISGLLKLRDGDGKRTEIKLRYTIQPNEAGWQGIYETFAKDQTVAEQLSVIHRGESPTQYQYQRMAITGNASQEPIALSGPEAAIPFAGSDFWLSDLGLEFLHWPEQRLIKDAKITMRLGRSCKVLESTNPKPSENDYMRVRSWIDSESGGLIYAEAYDRAGQRLKVFTVKVPKKDHSEVEIRNEKTDSRTYLEFPTVPK